MSRMIECKTDPELLGLLEEAARYEMTEEEIAAQRASWVRAFSEPCEHGELDWETCSQCGVYAAPHPTGGRVTP